MDRGNRVFFTLREVNIGLWGKAIAKAALERKNNMRDHLRKSQMVYNGGGDARPRSEEERDKEMVRTSP